MMTQLKRLWRDERGASAIEYGLIAALISILIVTAATGAGTSLRTLFENLSTQLQGAVTASGGAGGGG